MSVLEIDPSRHGTLLGERRVKIVSLRASIIVNVFNWWTNPTSHVQRIVCDALPNDVIVHSVSSNWECNTIELQVLHESFPSCEEGCIIDRIPGVCRLEMVEVERRTV